jgi:hypothetical protein
MVQLPHKVKGNVKKSRPQYGLEEPDTAQGQSGQT